MATPRPLFDFSEPARSGGFVAIDDAVMGGRSHSRATAADRVLRFEGVVSLEAGGGFASVRSAPAAFDLAGSTGLVLRILGDGKRYKVNLRTDDGFDGVSWQAAFDTATGGWEVILLPFERFEPVLRGRPAPAAGPLQPSQVRTVGLLVSDRQAGPFRLDVAAIAGYALADGVVSLPPPASP